MLVSNEVISVVGAVGLIALALSWHKRNASPVRLAQIGWLCVGLYFFNDASLYLAHDDLILTLFSVMTLPMAVGMAVWEARAEDEKASRHSPGLVVRLPMQVVHTSSSLTFHGSVSLQSGLWPAKRCFSCAFPVVTTS